MAKQNNDRNLVGFKIQQGIYNSAIENFDVNFVGVYNVNSSPIFSLPDI